jgi:hypothetical protein
MIKQLKCPVCNSLDLCKFVFCEHILNDGTPEISNPSDLHFIFICPKLHVSDGIDEIKTGNQLQVNG